MSDTILVDLIAGARPNFMKIAPIIDAMRQARANGSSLDYRLIHTGQHYDRAMSEQFFQQLGIPEPDINLHVGSGTQAEQTAAVMVRYESVLMKEPSRACVVVGDVTSTMACAITAQKLHVPVAHVEGGIRSGDWRMPEEINRLATDAVSNWFFTTSKTANDNLLKSGVGQERIFFVGNTMIDTLIKQKPNFQKPELWDHEKLKAQSYFVMTLHRPANVDEEKHLRHLVETVVRHANGVPIVFPVHPRTARSLKDLSLPSENLILTGPMGYLEFNYLIQHAKAVLTDSGGVTEETTVLGVPCMTLRDSTERPETITQGTNELAGTDPGKWQPYFEQIHAGEWKQGSIPELWDGCAAQRIVRRLRELLEKQA